MKLRYLCSVSYKYFTTYKTPFSSTYNYFNNKGIKNITRLRLGLSHLRDHKFKHGFFTLLIQSAIANWILKQLVIIYCIAPILQIKD